MRKKDKEMIKKNKRRRKEKLFRKLYLSNGFNARRAYMRAFATDEEGYAGVNGCLLLKEPRIMSKIDRELTKMFMKLDITNEAILAQQAAIAFIDTRGFYDESGCFKDIHELNIIQQSVIESIETEELWEGQGEERRQIGIKRRVKFYSRQKGIDNLMRYKRMINDNSINNVHIGDKKIELTIEANKLEDKLGADGVIELRNRLKAKETQS